MTYTLFDRTITTLTALAERHDEGTAAEQETAQVLHALLYAIKRGRTAELYAEIGPLLDKWLDESLVFDGRAAGERDGGGM